MAAVWKATPREKTRHEATIPHFRPIMSPKGAASRAPRSMDQTKPKKREVIKRTEECADGKNRDYERPLGG